MGESNSQSVWKAEVKDKFIVVLKIYQNPCISGIFKMYNMKKNYVHFKYLYLNKLIFVKFYELTLYER